MAKERIREQVDENDKFSWSYGGEGTSIEEFVNSHPCMAVKLLVDRKAVGPKVNNLYQGIVSSIGGIHKVVEFSKEHNCGYSESDLSQIY